MSSGHPGRQEAPVNAGEVRGRQDLLQLVDVRHPHEWEAGHIPGATHIPLDQLDDELGGIDRGRLVVAVCHSGGRSAEAAQRLQAKGFKAESLEGGMLAWAAAALPVISSDGQPGIVLDPGPPEELAPELAGVRDNLVEIWSAFERRFGSRPPTDEEARSFAIEWLMSKGKSAKDAVAFLDS